MNGVVLDWNENTNAGLIRGVDGARYKFGSNVWLSAKTPKTGVNVDFEIKDGLAVDIYAIDNDMFCDTKDKLTEIWKKTARATKPFLNRLFQIMYIVYPATMLCIAILDEVWKYQDRIINFSGVFIVGLMVAVILQYLLLGTFPKDIFKTKND